MSIRIAVLAAALVACASIEVYAVQMAGPEAGATARQAQLVAKLAAKRTTLGLDADHGFRVAQQHPGAQGTTVVRVDHTYKGVRVFGSESVVVTDTEGAIISESVADRRAGLGRGKANLLGAATRAFDVTPTVGEAEAIDAATRRLGQQRSIVAPPRAELIVYPVMRSERTREAAKKREEDLNAFDLTEVVAGYELAWLVQSRFVVAGRPVYRDAIVSARDGHIIAEWDALQTADGVGLSQYNGKVPLSTTQDGKLYRMIDTTRAKGGTYGGLAVTNADHGTSAGEVYTSEENTWGDGKQYIDGGSTTNANGQTAAVNAMWGMANAYDTLRNTLGWHSMDGKDSATYINAHVNTAYDNAYYDDSCKCMFIGDGSMFFSLGAVDVVGHEMSHGVTAATSRLLYFGESGGLNESSSDIVGDVVEGYARGGGSGDTIPASQNDWVLGKEISKNGTPLRWMYKPSLDGRSPDAWSTQLRRLDVHYSSGPNNRMFYFLSQGSNDSPDSDFYSKYLTAKPAAMTGIGIDKAYRIWFLALTTKFTMVTNYADARKKMVAAAEELYGKGSRESIAVQRAYAAINVGPDIDEPPKGRGR